MLCKSYVNVYVYGEDIVFYTTEDVFVNILQQNDGRFTEAINIVNSTNLSFQRIENIN